VLTMVQALAPHRSTPSSGAQNMSAAPRC